jgi:hypothetical protein
MNVDPIKALSLAIIIACPVTLAAFQWGWL